MCICVFKYEDSAVFLSRSGFLHMLKGERTLTGLRNLSQVQLMG